MNLWNIYHPTMPDFVRAIADTPAMRRLQDVGMNCGCEYTSFPLFQNLESYSRFDHSVGCGLMVWHFTQDPRQTVAALLHDVASPAFAHVIDFLNGDHERQESTEDTTESVIAESPELMKLLTEMNLTLEDVADYHLYPIADNDTPRLSADRLEYTLGNIVNYRIGTRDDVKRYYDNLIVGRNEEGTEELMFSDLQTALDFGMTTLRTSRIYVCDEDRYSMQTLAELLKKHIERGILNVNDLYTTEKKVIALLEKDEEAKNDWLRFRSSHKMIKDGVPAEGKIIAAKKRHINPMVSGLGRLTDLSEEFAEKMQEFMSASFDMPLWGI